MVMVGGGESKVKRAAYFQIICIKREKRKRKKQDRGIVDFMMVTNHFFHSLKEWILEMEDPRN